MPSARISKPNTYVGKYSVQMPDHQFLSK